MSVIAFEGPAGTGKTTSLMNQLAEGLKNHPLSPQERVLALTFMHGSSSCACTRTRQLRCARVIAL